MTHQCQQVSVAQYLHPPVWALPVTAPLLPPSNGLWSKAQQVAALPNKKQQQIILEPLLYQII